MKITDNFLVLLFILVPCITLGCCVLTSIEEHKEQEKEWRYHHDKYKWGDPPMPHGDDTNSVMDPWGTNGWGR